MDRDGSGDADFQRYPAGLPDAVAAVGLTPASPAMTRAGTLTAGYPFGGLVRVLLPGMG